jgi:hypothetical protein
MGGEAGWGRRGEAFVRGGNFSSGLNGEVRCANDVKYDLRWKMCYRMIQWGCLATTGGSPLFCIIYI